MAIEFRCPDCQQLLRVPDDSAGKNARCPQCSSRARVPEASQPASPPASPPLEQPQWPFSEGNRPPAKPFADAGPAAPLNPYATPAAAIQSAAASPFQPGAINPQKVGVEPIFSHAWQVWQANLGLLAGVTFVALAITLPIDIGSQFVHELLAQQGEASAGRLVESIGSIISNLLELWLGIGQAQIALKLARGLPAQFGDLFGGGSRFFPVLGGSILAGLALVVGLLLCIVPGIFLMLMFWPFYYLVVDEKAPVMESFEVAKTITEGNWGTVSLLWLVSIVVGFVGLLACGVGILLAIPLITLIWATAYLMMSGQLSTSPLFAPPVPQPLPAGL
jgi:DNA-directed RNA polymerase subunit RPC12/RpoP